MHSPIYRVVPAIFGLSLAFSLLLPYHVYPFTSFYQDWIVLFSLGVLLLFLSRHNNIQLELPWIALTPLILVLWVVIQCGLGWGWTLWGVFATVGALSAAAAAVVMGASLSGTCERRHYTCSVVFIAILMAALLSVGLATIQLFALESHFGDFVIPISHSHLNKRPFANIAQPNQLALLFCIGIAIAKWSWQVNVLRGGVAVIVVVLLMWGLAVTQSRTAWLVLPTFGFLMAWMDKRWSLRSPPAIAVITAIAVYVVSIGLLPTFISDSGEIIDHYAKRANGIHDRITYLRQALEISLMFPLTGVGWGNFGSYQFEIAASFPPAHYSLHAHNLILHLAAELGWVIVGLLIVMAIHWLRRILNRSQLSSDSACVLLILSAVLMHSMVEFPLWYAYVLIPISLLIGVVHQEAWGSSRLYVPRAMTAVAALGLCVGLLIAAIDYRKVVVGFRDLGFITLGLEADQSLVDHPKMTLFGHYYDYFAFALKPARSAMTDAELDQMDAVAKNFSFAPVLMRLAIANALNGRIEEAISTLKRLQKLHPDKYSEAYQSWIDMSTSQGGAFGEVYLGLPVPISSNTGR